MYQPLISICIPAYKQPQLVARCLDSIAKQDYPSIQVIISDDTPGEDIKQIIKSYSQQLKPEYYHNQPSLGSPANWNAALDKAKGQLVMLMHHDDWLNTPDAVSPFVKSFEEDIDFVFCRNTAVDEKGTEIVLQSKPALLKELDSKPNHLLIAPVIGPPSNVMLRRSVDTRYDEQLIWLVDIDYYVRLLKSGCRYRYIDQHLVNIGMHGGQTTAWVHNNNHIILKENLLFAAKMESTAFRDIMIYDYYWRLLRNFKVRRMEDVAQAGVEPERIPRVIIHMLKWQKRFSLSILKTGVFSKMLMTLSYITKPSVT